MWKVASDFRVWLQFFTFDFKVNFPTAKITSLISHAKSFTLASARDHRTINNFKMSKKERKLQKDKKNDQNSPSMGKVFILLRLTAKFLAIFPHWLCCVVVGCQVGGWEDKNVFILPPKDGKATKQLKAIMRVVFLRCRRRRRDISRVFWRKLLLFCDAVENILLEYGDGGLEIDLSLILGGFWSLSDHQKWRFFKLFLSTWKSPQIYSFLCIQLVIT